jgi:hypothetical protein
MMTLIAFLQGTELLEPAWSVASSGDDAISQSLPDYQHQTCVGRLDPFDPSAAANVAKGAILRIRWSPE